MATLKDADGNDVEAFTQEELDAAKTEAVEAAKAEVQPQLEAAQTKVTALSQEIEKIKANGANAGALREKTEQLDTAKAELEKKVDAATTAAAEATKKVDDMASSRLAEIKDGLVGTLAGSDAELAKKIQFHFDHSTAGPLTTKAEIEARVTNAYTIATGKPPAGVLVGAAISGAGGGSAGSSPTWTPDETDLAGKFGISAETLKKHNKKA